MNKVTVAEQMPGASGFTMAVWSVHDMPVGSVVGKVFNKKDMTPGLVSLIWNETEDVWNSKADSFNQWCELGMDEKLELFTSAILKFVEESK